MAALASDWLRHFRLLLRNRWVEFNETWQEARSQRSLPSLCFSGQSEKQDGCHGLWLVKTFSTSSLKLLNRIQRNLTGRKISTSSTKFVFFMPIGKTRWPPWPLIGWDIFDFSSETAEWNSTKLDRKQDLNIFYQVCVFLADWKIKMAALASDWLRQFRLLLWNHWTEFNNTCQEARSQCLLPSLCFSGQTEKQDGRHALWDTFDFSSETAEWNSRKLNRKLDLNVHYQVHVLWANQKNKMAALASDWLRQFRLLLWNHWTEFNNTCQEARSQCLLPSLCFSGQTEKQDGRRALWDTFDFSSETAKWNSRKLNRKLDLNVHYQVHVLWANQKNKMAALASDWLRHFLLLLWNRLTEFNQTWQEARS